MLLTTSADEVFLLPRDDELDPLSLGSVGSWVERMAPRRKSRKAPRAQARSLAATVQRMWPGIDSARSSREITLTDPEAPFSVAIAEDRARVSRLREPLHDEPCFALRIVTAISRETGWLGYDPRAQDIVEGVTWRCAACGCGFGVQRSTCPSCGATPSRDSLTWVEPSPMFPPSRSATLIDLRPLLWQYGVPDVALTDSIVTEIEEELSRAIDETLETPTPVETCIEHPPPTGIGVMQCVEVVETITDPARQIALADARDEFGDMDVGDDLLFSMAITPEDQARGRADDERYGFLPMSLCRPELARPIWSALRPMLARIARDLGEPE